ncbi:phosphocarrier protein [Paenibacillus phyllosphaerae]|uniref:Phosphocarrier protein HPr n=1 Tax=Paenibacillus phyllosphaerae TaxID=274593 RepID=A0A7W5B3G7_9BACL|nr:HPr family phosphocarrier protein [Paenibacillus phyllosphaerae]MBB3113733.1 phosphocarrier protein [Paenibacillus phyllosphaerae]
MLKRSYTLLDPDGLHARPANELVYTAGRYLDCALFAEFDGRRVTLHSILGFLTLTARQGGVLTVTADGPNEIEALDALQAVIEREGIGQLIEAS